MTRSWSIATLTALLFLIVATAARAATITVDTLSDTSDREHCSLRNAITAADDHAPVNACAARRGANTIVFASGFSGTITLSEALPDIHSNLSIIGPSAGITISGNNAFPIMFIDEGTLGKSTVALSNLTFTAASYDFGGGAINNNGTLGIDNCTFSDNRANNGAAMVSIGTLTIRNSTFSGNNALVGGALSVTRVWPGTRRR